MYKGPDSYNIPPNPNIWGNEKKRERGNFADAAYPKGSQDSEGIFTRPEDDNRRLADIDKAAQKAETERERLANELAGEFTLMSEANELSDKNELPVTDSRTPNQDQLNTIDAIYNEPEREVNLARVVNPGPKTPHDIEVSTPDVNMNDITYVNTVTGTEIPSDKPTGQIQPALEKKSFWQRLFFG